jgi:LacI family transcriptional regulator
MKRPVKIDDIAALANTSTATVSRALNNKPGVTEATRQRIIKLAEELNYRPNRIAQNLALQKSHLIGFVAADLLNVVYIDFFRRVQKIVEPLGYQVLISDSEQDISKERHNIEVLRQHRAEGLIIFPIHDWHSETPVDHLIELRLRKFPFVVLGSIKGYGLDCVTSDEIGVARELTAHLLSLGHKRVGFIGHDPENRCVNERFEGVRLALREAGLDIDPAHVVAHREGWQEGVRAVLQGAVRPTALVFMNDVLALMAHRLISDLGFEVPRDLSVATFDNGIWTQHLRPTLTTTVENPEEIARVATNLLLERIETPDGAPQTKLIPQRLIIRESTGPAPQS